MNRDDAPTLEWCLGCRNRLSECVCNVPEFIEDGPPTTEIPHETIKAGKSWRHVTAPSTVLNKESDQCRTPTT